MISVVFARGVIWRSIMNVKNHFIVPDCEHYGNINYFTEIITENGGIILKVYWDDMVDDDAIIIYSCPNEKMELIKTALENG